MIEQEQPKIQEQSLATTTQHNPKSTLDFTEIPFILNNYRIMIFWSVVSGVVLFYIIFFAWGLFQDLKNTHEHKMQQSLLTVKRCTDEYQRNRCSPNERVEALEEYCT